MQKRKHRIRTTHLNLYLHTMLLLHKDILNFLNVQIFWTNFNIMSAIRGLHYKFKNLFTIKQEEM